MSKIVILGHGDFKPGSGPSAPEVLIPPNTTLQFYSDAGQALVLPRKEGYEKVADVWSQLQTETTDHGPGPLKQGQVTYNFRLTPDTTPGHRERALGAAWGAKVLFTDKDDLYLCTGRGDICPTPVLNVVAARHQELKESVLPKLGPEAERHLQNWLNTHSTDGLPDELVDFINRRLRKEISDDYKLSEAVRDEYDKFVVDGVPAGAWDHGQDCKGILKLYAGNELHWIACTAFKLEGADDEMKEVVAEMPVLDTADVSGPGMNKSTWEPGRSDEGVIYRIKNYANLETILYNDAKTLAVVATGKVALIGTEHGREPAEYVRAQPDMQEGQIKLSPFKNTLVVTGITSADNRKQVESAIKFTDDESVTVNMFDDWTINFK
jgi:hypothetical protein